MSADYKVLCEFFFRLHKKKYLYYINISRPHVRVFIFIIFSYIFYIISILLLLLLLLFVLYYLLYFHMYYIHGSVHHDRIFTKMTNKM